jgi:hypothetical protein
MNTLGVALIVLGLALLCGGLIFYKSSEEPVDEGQQDRPRNKRGDTEDDQQLD